MEIWKDIEGYNGNYQVSNLGNVRSMPRNGTVKYPKMLKQKIQWNGRMSVSLNNKYRIRQSKSVHRIVAFAFIPNPENKPCINHIDGNPKNNSVENLEWCTHTENMKHAFATGLHSLKGDRHNNRKLDSEKVKLIRYLNGKLSHADIAYCFGVCRPTITMILNNQIW